MRNFLLSVLFFSLSAWSYGQLDAPVLLCDSVGPDGSVTLSWEPVPDPGNIFTAYTVFYKPNPAASFTQVGQVNNIAQTSFLHATAGADSRSRFYYVVTESTLGSSVTSDTLETIFLYFETDDNENISLYWNATHDPPLPSPNVNYQVFREYPPGNWTLLATVPGLSYDHHFWFCNNAQHTVNFKIVTTDPAGSCGSVSNLSGTVLSNLGQPDIPPVDSVSITPSGEAILGWQPGLAQDIEGYIIYRVTSINDSIAFVPGISSTVFIDSNADPCDAPVRYAIAALDSCGNKSPGTFLTPHETLFLEEIDYDPCFLENTLSWNPYQNFDPPLAGYEVHFSIDNGPFNLLVTLDPSVTSWTHQGLAPTTLYTYYIRAFNQGRSKTSTSCKRERRTYNSPYPQFMYLRYVTVAAPGRIEMLFYSDTSAHVNGYKIYRGRDLSSFSEIATISPGADFTWYIDEEAETSAMDYYYRVSVIDSCSNELFIANTSRTIFLQVESSEDLTNLLTWNEYESWDAGVDGYRVFRKVGEGALAQEIAVTGPGELEYLDDISSLSGSGGRISYYVVAFEKTGNQYGFEDVSQSNEVLADVAEKVFLPNAFAPKGINNRFKPVGTFIGEENYLFSVYSRWGQKIFETSSPGDAWDGTFNGSYVTQGVYVYMLRFTTATGEAIIRKGTVAVIF